MKVIALISVLFLLCGCSDPLLKVGYSETEVEWIRSLEEANQEVFKDTYREDYLALIKEDGFEESQFSLYLEFLDDYALEDLITLVARGFDEFTLMDLRKIYEDPYFIMENAELYLEYPKSSVRETVEYVNTKRIYKQYTETEESDLSKGDLLLVNKYHSLGRDFVPEDLVNIKPEHGINGKLKKNAYKAYQKMYEAAREDGMDFFITSPYRPYSSQERIYNQYLSNSSQEVVDTHSARPGYSEHQTGLAVDILTTSSDFDTFERTDEAKWLYKNAHRFGFILRYPEDKEDITGYMYEPWHYRYVGDIAEEIKESGLTYDEYYAYYLN